MINIANAKTPLLSGLLAAGLCFGAAADATQLRFASGTPPGSMGEIAVDEFIKAVESHSEGEIQVRGFIASLLSFMETPDGIRDGIADLGTVLVAYFPSTFPTTTMFTELTMSLAIQEATPKQSTFAYTGAVSYFVMNHCDACMDEHHKENQVYLGMAGSPPYGLFCTRPVRSQEEFEGRRIRVGGPQWSRWVTEFGGTPLSIPVNETFEALSQGVVDCTAHNLPDLLNFMFIDVVTDITMGVPGSTFGGVGTTINRETWQRLTEQERESVLYGAAAINAEIAWQYLSEHREALRQLDERSDEITMHEPDPSFQEVTRAFQEADLEAVPERYAQRHGVQNGAEMTEAFTEVLAKWMDLVEDVETRDELVQLYWDEIFSKIDVTSYGL